ncbi:MAG: hypothetical protein Q7V57_11030 [Actinomycetota bacterium]|nr:hypothetical protein [Actinomycetota bacterium]
MRPRSPAAFPAAFLALALGATGALGACSDDATKRTEGNYCNEVSNHLTDLSSPVIVTPEDIDRVIDSWRAVASTAPLAVQQEWNIVVISMETAAAVDPNDPASVQHVADTARASERAANRVISYTMERCGIQIGTPPPAP